MARFTAGSATNMKTALNVLDSEVTFSQLLAISETGEHQLWNINGKGLEVDLSVIFNEGSPTSTFSASFSNIELHSGTSESTSTLWSLVDNPLSGMLSVQGSATLSGDDYDIYVSIPGLFHASVTVTFNGDTFVVGDLDYGWDNGSAPDSFVPYVFRLADIVTGSVYNDLLKGHGGNDVIRGDGGSDQLYGDAGADKLYGDAGADKLYGGAGNDKLTGGAGADKFVFDTALNATSNKDTILDFRHLTDRIWLDDDIFKKLGQESVVRDLLPGRFKVLNASAELDGNDFILYKKATGELFYDTNGVDPGGRTLFAVLGTDTHPTLTYADFQVIA